MATTTTTTMTASGKVIAVQNGLVVFNPAGTSYELRLISPGYSGPIGKPVKCVIRVTARKIWTVSSGGNFIAPIFGPPKTIQGRVRSLDTQSMVVHAGTNILVELPSDDSAFDLTNGPIAINSLVNVTALPGARAEFLNE